jgi:hypothetical protein
MIVRLTARANTLGIKAREKLEARVKGQDSEAGLTTMEMVIWGAGLLAIAIAGFALIKAVYDRYAAQIV